MDIERFKHQHTEILDGIATLRKFSQAGVKEHAHEIAHAVVALSTVVKLHLAIEDRILYPALQNGSDPKLSEMGRAYQEDMKGIASSYIAFSRQWSSAATIAAKAEQFRSEANTVLKTVYTRMLKENKEFYPAIETM